MSRLPVISGRQAVRAFGKAGWQTARFIKNHYQLVKQGRREHLSVPDHKELDRGLLRALIRVSGLTVQQFVDLLE
ncbi:MAG: type II toxin-antitoxin system HicA family toxin [Candidatus Methylomirabilales bacterium]